MSAKNEFLAALGVVQWHVECIRRDVATNRITIEQAGVKLRSKSIELDAIACMPFRDDKASKR